ncbi:lysozyme family protein [Exiguobacterium sp. BRG2]|uniref:lysozyme family protein n=1 Tax=Exiguobacterium sp. BRG2 TaxID=2962584 RepID=UPI002881338E|nr:lysozyme family protein [Exiguobacterium sp. BRG2]MDT0173102.1 lysozyme family protein [Exiguobacterium sp. BRG2]
MWSTVRQSARVAVRMKWRLLTLKYRLIALGIALLLLLLIIIVAGILDTLTGIENDQATETPIAYSDASLQVSDDVLQYREAIARELKKEQLEGQTNVVLALMMQESGGRGNDPMQASESKCGRIGCITSPDESIQYGVKHFASVFRQANKDVKLTLQSYNFGGGFIDYVQENGGRYTKQLAISFSQMMYQRVKKSGIYQCHRPSAIEHQACYGDIEYVDAVLRYLTPTVLAEGKTGPIKGKLHAPLDIPLQMTSGFGSRIVFGKTDVHTGIDFSCHNTDTVHAVRSGTVTYSGLRGPYGQLIQIKQGDWITAYAHLSARQVKTGQKIEAGQAIGMCGSTGRSTGNHLHIEFKTSDWSGHIDPAPLFSL